MGILVIQMCALMMVEELKRVCFNKQNIVIMQWISLRYQNLCKSIKQQDTTLRTLN